MIRRNYLWRFQIEASPSGWTDFCVISSRKSWRAPDMTEECDSVTKWASESRGTNVSLMDVRRIK